MVCSWWKEQIILFWKRKLKNLKCLSKETEGSWAYKWRS